MIFENKNSVMISGYIMETPEIKKDKNGKSYCFFDIKSQRVDLKVGVDYEFFDIRFYEDTVAELEQTKACAGWGIYIKGIWRRVKNENKRYDYIKVKEFKLFPPEKK